MLLCNGRDAKADLILLQLGDPATWQFDRETNYRDDGALIDRDTLDRKVPEILIHAQDTIMDKDMNTRVVLDNTITQWIILYHVTKVLKLRKNMVDWERLFDEEEVPQE
jgi:hypothetical protein